MFTLREHGVLAHLLETEEVSLSDLSQKFKANEGYLNVALRILCSQGWLEQEVNNADDVIIFRITPLSKIAFELAPLYADVVDLIKFSEGFHHRKFEIEPFRKLERIFEKYKANYGIEFSADETIRQVQEQVLKHIEGLIVGPTVVHLGMNGMFHKYFMEAPFRPEEFHADHESFRKILDLFAFLGWFDKKNDTYQFSEKGLFYAKRATAYGVTVSYIPTFRKLDDLIFGNPEILRNNAAGETEKHVDRAMNVWGSGGAHSGYFKVVDEILIELFNKPIEEQPRGVLDMGSGNGAFLQHIFGLIENQTTRGQMLEEHPLFLVGADYNETARRISKKNLINADIWAKVIWGDIGRPDLLSETLQNDYGIDLKDLLNVRTFLDHNRIWQAPEVINTERQSTSSGAFAHRGKRISNNHIEDSLLEHFKKWAPYVEKFGLLLIELHTVSPALIAKAIGKSAATAYDATHGYSDQYIVEIDVFHRIAREAGLHPDMKLFRKFPNSELATISINLLKVNRSAFS